MKNLSDKNKADFVATTISNNFLGWEIVNLPGDKIKIIKKL